MPAIGEEKGGFPQGPILVDGYYPATLKEAKEYTRTNQKGEEYTRIAWIFDVTATEDDIDEDVEYDEDEFPFTGHFEVAAHTGQNRSTYSTSAWFQVDMDKIIDEDMTSTDEAIGRPCVVNVSSYVGNDDQTHNKVEKIRPPKKGQKGAKTTPKQQAKAKKAEEAEVNEEDFEEIPF